MATGSFIPDKPVRSGGKTRNVKRVYLLAYAVYIFFAVSVLSTIGVWLYKQYLLNELAIIETQVQEEQQQFDSDMLSILVSFEERLDQAKRVYNTKTNVAGLLSALEEVLLTNVTLTSFSYDNVAGQVVLTLKPEFQNINDALYQREIINDHSLFSQSTINDIVMAEAANNQNNATSEESVVIQYSVVAQIDREALRSYEAEIMEQQPASEADEVTSLTETEAVASNDTESTSTSEVINEDDE